MSVILMRFKNGRFKKFFIDGKWIIPNSTNIFPVIDPSNEKIFAEIILGNDKDVEAAVYAAKKAFNIFSSFQKVID